MIRKLIRWMAGIEDIEPAPLPEPQERNSFFSTDIDTNDTLSKSERVANLLQRAFPKTAADTYVMTGDGKTLTTYGQDSNEANSSLKAIYNLGSVGIPEAQAYWYGSQGFIGYQMCALMAQHWLINKACMTPARDAIRKGYKITSNDGTEIPADIHAAIAKGNKKYRLDRNLVEFVKMGRVFGVRIALFKIESNDEEFYSKPFNADSILPGSYKGITQVDPYWCVPELTSASASDPSAIDFYEPTYWIINNRRYHKSHLIIMRGPEVPDILKPSYLYGGLSVPQMIYERVYAAERTANEAPQLALTKRAVVLTTDAARAMANQSKFEENLSIWARFRDNYGVKVVDMDDKLEQHDTSLADLDAVIMTQYQIVAAATNIPVNKLMGTQMKGFSTGEGEAENYHEELESIQTNDMEPLIDRHMICLIRSEIVPRFGGQPFDVDCTWEPVNSLSSEALAAVNLSKANTAKILSVDIGAISGEEVREMLIADELSGFSGLDIEEDNDDYAEPTEAAATEPKEEDVAQQSMNGAQIASMLEVMNSVATGMIPRSSGIEALTLAFPISAQQAEKMMGEIGRGFAPATPPPAPVGFGK